jgi:hypothetical protein
MAACTGRGRVAGSNGLGLFREFMGVTYTKAVPSSWHSSPLLLFPPLCIAPSSLIALFVCFVCDSRFARHHGFFW